MRFEGRSQTSCTGRAQHIDKFALQLYSDTKREILRRGVFELAC